MSIETIPIRARQARALIAPMVRAVEWPSIVVAGCVSAAMVTLMRAGDSYHPGSALRWTAVVLSLGVAFLLDDGAATLTASAPATLLYRRALRLGLGTVVVGAVWGALVMYATAGDAREALLGRVTLELTTLASLTLFISALASRFAANGRGGIAAGPASLAFLVVAWRLPARWKLLVDPAHPRWDDAGRDLAVVACVACLGLLVLSFDPARRRVAARLFAGRTAAAGAGHIGSAGE